MQRPWITLSRLMSLSDRLRLTDRLFLRLLERYQIEVGQALPRFNLRNVRALGKQVRRDRLPRAGRLVRRMLAQP